jgi:hypothetical protein
LILEKWLQGYERIHDVFSERVYVFGTIEEVSFIGFLLYVSETDDEADDFGKCGRKWVESVWEKGEVWIIFEVLLYFLRFLRYLWGEGLELIRYHKKDCTQNKINTGKYPITQNNTTKELMWEYRVTK